MLYLILAGLAISEDNVVYKKKTEIDFESVEIEGQIKKPPGAFIKEKEKAIFNPLVQIREAWVNEMTQSVNDIQ